MLKTRFTANLAIFATALLLLCLSMGANISSSYAAVDDGYVAPATSPSVRPLGQTTIPANTNMQNVAPVAAQPAAGGPAEDDLPPLEAQQSGNIIFITGGIGDEERNQLQSVQKDYNLRVLSATKNGAFAGDTQIVILDHNSGALLSTTAGPIFYAKLPSGTYTVQATHEGVTKEQKIAINHNKAAQVHLSW